jgi:hypothetical protein
MRIRLLGRGKDGVLVHHQAVRARQRAEVVLGVVADKDEEGGDAAQAVEVRRGVQPVVVVVCCCFGVVGVGEEGVGDEAGEERAEEAEGWAPWLARVEEA